MRKASFWVAVACWGLSSGLGVLFNINTGSLRQAIVPGHLLGRIVTIAMVLAWSANPLGAIFTSIADPLFSLLTGIPA